MITSRIMAKNMSREYDGLRTTCNARSIDAIELCQDAARLPINYATCQLAGNIRIDYVGMLFQFR